MALAPIKKEFVYTEDHAKRNYKYHKYWDITDDDGNVLFLTCIMWSETANDNPFMWAAIRRIYESKKFGEPLLREIDSAFNEWGQDTDCIYFQFFEWNAKSECMERFVSLAGRSLSNQGSFNEFSFGVSKELLFNSKNNFYADVAIVTMVGLDA